MALAQDDVVVEEVEVEVVEVEVVETEETAEPTEPTKPAIEHVESPKMAADDMAAEYAGEAGDGEHPFLDGLSWQLMASAFYRIGGYVGDGVLAGTYNTLGYPYTNYNGFGLNFAGGDVMYTGEKFAVRLDLRFGEGATLLTPIVPVKQAYATWMPTDKLNFDVGFFDTIYGAEVVDEWNNANYTRGALYFLRQPFNHMGLRMGAELGSIVGMTVMVTNGGVYGGTPIDNNETPAIGWQFGFSPDGHNSVRRRGLREGSREVGLFIGGNHAASGNNANKDWDSFFDFVLSMGFNWFHFILNGDYFLNGNQTDLAGGNTADFQYGHSLALIFDVADHWSIGLRGENLSGNSFFRENTTDFGGLSTGTITLRYMPVEYLVISLEGRGEWATREMYFSRGATTIMDPVTMEEILVPNQKKNYAAILGVTAHIGN
jgi:hypothetical protein